MATLEELYQQQAARVQAGATGRAGGWQVRPSVVGSPTISHPVNPAILQQAAARVPLSPVEILHAASIGPQGTGPLPGTLPQVTPEMAVGGSTSRSVIPHPTLGGPQPTGPRPAPNVGPMHGFPKPDPNSLAARKLFFEQALRGDLGPAAQKAALLEQHQQITDPKRSFLHGPDAEGVKLGGRGTTGNPLVQPPPKEVGSNPFDESGGARGTWDPVKKKWIRTPAPAMATIKGAAGNVFRGLTSVSGGIAVTTVPATIAHLANMGSQGMDASGTFVKNPTANTAHRLGYDVSATGTPTALSAGGFESSGSDTLTQDEKKANQIQTAYILAGGLDSIPDEQIIGGPKNIQDLVARWSTGGNELDWAAALNLDKAGFFAGQDWEIALAENEVAEEQPVAEEEAASEVSSGFQALLAPSRGEIPEDMLPTDYSAVLDESMREYSKRAMDARERYIEGRRELPLCDRDGQWMSFLAGIADAASGWSPDKGIGNLLAGIGGGGLASLEERRRYEKEESDQYSEQMMDFSRGFATLEANLAAQDASNKLAMTQVKQRHGVAVAGAYSDWMKMNKNVIRYDPNLGMMMVINPMTGAMQASFPMQDLAAQGADLSGAMGLIGGNQMVVNTGPGAGGTWEIPIPQNLFVNGKFNPGAVQSAASLITAMATQIHDGSWGAGRDSIMKEAQKRLNAQMAEPDQETLRQLISEGDTKAMTEYELRLKRHITGVVFELLQNGNPAFVNHFRNWLGKSSSANTPRPGSVPNSLQSLVQASRYNSANRDD